MLGKPVAIRGRDSNCDFPLKWLSKWFLFWGVFLPIRMNCCWGKLVLWWCSIWLLAGFYGVWFFPISWGFFSEFCHGIPKFWFGGSTYQISGIQQKGFIDQIRGYMTLMLLLHLTMRDPCIIHSVFPPLPTVGPPQDVFNCSLSHCYAKIIYSSSQVSKLFSSITMSSQTAVKDFNLCH